MALLQSNLAVSPSSALCFGWAAAVDPSLGLPLRISIALSGWAAAVDPTLGLKQREPRCLEQPGKTIPSLYSPPISEKERTALSTEKWRYIQDLV